ncbi:metallophosphoesterase [Algoriphagus sp.]|uniref:metallophosphoesterase n=1 Tax=Algoriphagus sp. TaxID=1872435 RepID=UPI00391C6D24
MKASQKLRYLVFIGLFLCPIFSFAQSNFRILPYLQVADKNLIQIRWFADQNYSSSILIKDSKGNLLSSGNVQGVEIPDLYYTTIEKSQTIAGLDGQNWIGGDKYFRYEYSIRVPFGENVTYEVQLNGQQFTNGFKSAPDSRDWENIRFIALSDSETEPLGRVTNRAWYPGQPLIRFFTVPALWKQKFGTTLEGGFELPNYFLTEKDGYSANLEIINSRKPDFMVMPGDLVQGGGYMPAWDEFWRHNSGEFGNGLSSYPIIPALGNWESFGGLNNGYGINEKGQFNPVVGRKRFHSFFEIDIEDPLQKHRQSYYRTDYGPITILTLDSSNGTPEEKRSDTPIEQRLKNKEYTGPGTDTQENFTQSEYNAAGGTDLSGFGLGTDQYTWLEANLKQAKEQKQLIFVQFHHVPYGSGEHGVPMNHELSTGQGGTPMRILHPLFEEYGVIAVLAGHDELFERSFVDIDGDGKGVHYYDVGVAGDGLRGVKRNWLSNPLATLDYNEFSKWTADQKSIEQWNTSGANPVLTDGGKHYGHLEVNLKKIQDGGKTFAQIDFEPVYAFPVMDQNYDLQRIERRVYNDPLRILVELEDVTIEPIFKKEITVELDEAGKVITTIKDYLQNEPKEDWKVEFSRSPEYTCSDLEGSENQIKITDNKGNTWTEVVLVKVKDQSPPTLVPKNISIDLDVTKGVVEITPEMVLAEFGDNCGIKSLTINKNRFTCEDIGKEVSVAIRAVDNSGNVKEAVVVVTIKRFAPEIVSLSGPNTFCEGENGKLELSSAHPFEVVRWRRNGVEIPGQTGKSLEVTQSGVYHAIIRYQGGCLAESKDFEVKVNPLPKGEIAVDGNILLAPEGDFTYQWFRNGEKLEGSTSRTFTAQLMGEYSVELTSTAGCKAKLKVVTLTISGLFGKVINEARTLKIYPNPASDRVVLEFPDGALVSIPSLSLYSSEGKNVTDKVQISILNDSKVEIILNRLANGTYLIWVIAQDQKTYFGKLVILN